MDQTVEINEDLAEKLTPSKDDAGIDTMERVKILEAIAEVCMHQGEYHLATKKFTQAGNKIKVGTLVWNILGNIVILYIIVVEFFFLLIVNLQLEDINSVLELHVNTDLKTKK